MNGRIGGHGALKWDQKWDRQLLRDLLILNINVLQEPRRGGVADGHTSIEARLLLSSFPLACSTILLVIDSVYGAASAGWLILGGLAWSGIILSAGIILKTVWDCVRNS